MSSTIRVKCVKVKYSDLMFIYMPGDKRTVVIAPAGFGREGIEYATRAWLNSVKTGAMFNYGTVNLTDMFNQRMLKHPKNQKFYVDVAVKGL